MGPEERRMIKMDWDLGNLHIPELLEKYEITYEELSKILLS